MNAATTTTTPAPTVDHFRKFVTENLKLNYFEFTPDVLNFLGYYFEPQKKKSFLLHGPTGSGKTLLIKLLAAYMVGHGHISPKPLYIAAYNLGELFRKHNKFKKPNDNVQQEEELLQAINRHKCLIIDDLGAETPVSDFGTQRDLMQEILYSVYDRHTEGYRLMTTTNLSLKEIENRYGQRILSRLMEMAEYNRAALTGSDRRLSGQPMKINSGFWRNFYTENPFQGRLSM